MVFLKLLGPADECLPEAARRLSTRKAIAVVGYLAMRAPAAVQRSDLASLLWGDVPDHQARHSLRQCLLEIRAALAPYGSGLLTTDREAVRLDVTRMRVDARSMEWLLRRGTPLSLRRASALYRRDFLAGLRLQEPGFERWLAAERARFRALAWAALRERLRESLRSGATRDTVAVALRMMRIDRFAEPPRAVLLDVYAERGKFRAACRHYEAFARLLRCTFGSQPSSAMQSVFRECASRCGWIPSPRDATAASDCPHPSSVPPRREGWADV
jgi:DNA-binding SARP family transcriptional activator